MKRRRTKLQMAIEWVAMNDEPSWLWDNKDDVASQISVQLIADLWKIDRHRVADMVICVRIREKAIKKHGSIKAAVDSYLKNPSDT